MKLGILKSWFEKEYVSYVKAAEFLGVDYEIIDVLSEDWINKVNNSSCDGFLCYPPCDFQEKKSVYDERLYFLSHFMNKFIYPSFDELYIYENKRNMAYFLRLFEYPHPKTNVFAIKKDAQKYVENSDYPIVFKTNIGASATGVDIVESKKEALKIVDKIFGKFHPALSFGKLVWTKYQNIPIPKFGSAQKHYAIIQDFYKIKWEWRIIKIGNTYSGHQKLLKGKFASGSDLIGWVKPPLELLHLVKSIGERHSFFSLAVDIFETIDGVFLINEIQSMFGSYKHYQMKIDDQKGVYTYKNGDFAFCKGEFHQDNSQRLRIKHFIEILNAKKNN